MIDQSGGLRGRLCERVDRLPGIARICNAKASPTVDMDFFPQRRWYSLNERYICGR